MKILMNCLIILIFISFPLKFVYSSNLPLTLQSYLYITAVTSDPMYKESIDTTAKGFLSSKNNLRFKEDAAVDKWVNAHAEKKSNKEIISEVIKKSDSSLFILIRATMKGKLINFLELIVYDRDQNTLFHKASNNGKLLSKGQKIINVWLSEFYNTLSPVGELTSFSGQKISLFFDPLQFGRKIFSGAQFRIICMKNNQNDCGNLKNGESSSGIIVHSGNRKGEYIGLVLDSANLLSDDDHILKNLKVYIENSSISLNSKEINISEKLITGTELFKRSLRTCVVLPFTGNSPKLIKLRANLIDRLGKDGRCIGKEDKFFINIFKNYSENLKEYLKNPKVLRIVADQLGAGSIINVSIDKRLMGTEVALEIYNDGGHNILFRRSQVLNQGDPKVLEDLLYFWLLGYLKTLPFDATIIDSVSSRVLIDLGRKSIHENLQHFIIYRPYKVSYIQEGESHNTKWEMKPIAKGSIIKVQDSNTIGNILDFEKGETNVLRGDWVKLVGQEYLGDLKPVFIKHNLKNQRNIGRIKLLSSFSSISGGNNTEQKSELGAYLNVDLFLPYGWLIATEGEKTGDNLFKASLDKSNFRASLGYSFIYEGNRLVSLIEAYAGYMSSFFNTADMGIQGVGDLSYSGFFASLRFEIPLYQELMGNIRVDGSNLLELENTISLLGKAKSTFFYSLRFGIDYKLKKDIAVTKDINFSKNFSISAEVIMEKYTSKMTVDSANLNSSSNRARLGLTYHF